jgi:hypothetical protein
MANVIIKRKQVANLTLLNVLALRYIYERDEMTQGDICLLFDSVDAYSKQVNMMIQDLAVFEYICSLLAKDARNEFRQRKENFKKHGISWRKFHRLPEALLEASTDVRPN